jgi:hypothetical protein
MIIRVSGRPFYVNVSAHQDSSGYRCYFHEKVEFLGRTWGYSMNKNFSSQERKDVYDWFKEMVEKHTPADESGEEVLEKVVSRLEEDFEQVERE